VIAHVVLFSPRPSLTDDERTGLLGALERALTGIPAIRRARIGRRRRFGHAYDSVGPVQFEFAAVLEFDTEADLRTYLAHPVHADLGARFHATAQVAVAHDFDMVDGADLRALVP
jgi:hypothetical protein